VPVAGELVITRSSLAFALPSSGTVARCTKEMLVDNICMPSSTMLVFTDMR